MVHDVAEGRDRIRETLDKLDGKLREIDSTLDLLELKINGLVHEVREFARDISNEM